MSSTKIKLDRVPLTDIKINLNMPEKVYHQVQFLCKQIADVEWSGVLFYKVEGSIKDPASMKIILEDILPLNKGTKAYTEYTFDERLIHYMMENEHLEDCKIGHIHSHNTMGVFFSGTDWSELEDNAPNHNNYLSLIVNNYMEFCAKICFVAEAPDTEFTFFAKDEDGNKYEHSKAPYTVAPKLMVYDCEIDSPAKDIPVGLGFSQMVKNTIEAAKKVNTVVKSIVNPTTSTSQINTNKSTGGKNNKDLGWHSDWQEEYYVNSFGPKKDKIETKKETVYTPLSFEDEIEDSIEEFTMFILNTGNPLGDITTPEELAIYYSDMGITGAMLAGNVAKTFVGSYQKYYSQYKEEINNAEMFVKASEEVIMELEHITKTSKLVEVDEMFEPSLEVIKSILRQFEKADVI